MSKADELKQQAQELGDILSLRELINKYLKADKAPKAKQPKQNNKELLKVLKKEYLLEADELASIESIVSGKKKSDKQSPRYVVLSDSEKAALKAEIDKAVDAMNITIRDKAVSEADRLNKIKLNLSVRRGKIMSILNPASDKKSK